MVFARSMHLLNGEAVQLDEYYKDKVVLIVNVASACGLTPQYEGLEALYKEKQGQGLAIAAFPCNQFGAQEPGSAEDIQNFCSTKYGVTFDLFAKIDVNGEDACDLYNALTASEVGPAEAGPITWNFEKFLVGKDGAILARFGPKTTPDDVALSSAINQALN